MVIKIIKYAGTNGAAFIVDLAVLLALDYYTEFSRVYTSFFCYLLGTCVSFVLAKNFVFGRGWLAEKPFIEFIAYFLGGVIGAVITAVAFYLLAAIEVNNILIQKIIAGIFSFTTVFIYTNLFRIFRDILQ